jgi:transcriptional regulator with PAS, ATPase and Fis domain
MADRARLRRFLDRTENLESPLRALEAVRELRRYLTDVERDALKEARIQRASVQEIADALGITRQAVYYKLGQQGAGGPERTAEPDVVEIPDVEPSASDD